MRHLDAAGPKWRDFSMRTQDGRMIDISWAHILLSDGMRIAIGADITERKAAEEALRRAKAGLEERARRRTEELSTKNAKLEVEVAERRRAEAELHEKQHFMEEMLSAPDAIASW